MLARQNFFRNVVDEYLKAAASDDDSRYAWVRDRLGAVGAQNVSTVAPEREIEFLKAGLVDDPPGWMDALAAALGIPQPETNDDDEAEELPDGWNNLVGTMMTLHGAGFRRMHVLMDDEADFVVAVSCT